MVEKYKFLKISSVIFKVLAWVSVAVGIVSSIVIFVGGGTPDAPRSAGFIGLLLGVVYFFIFFTASEVVSLLLELSSKCEKGPQA
ncbi:MAG: hypothetical protein KKG21_04685 [Candidatus Omnitrophica bacterium]|nr:hypothetical protein [Candidatus Omnitrophota bacterium]